MKKSQELRELGGYKVDNDRTRSDLYQVSKGILKDTSYTGVLPEGNEYKEFIPQVVKKTKDFVILQRVRPLVGDKGQLLMKLTPVLISAIDEKIQSMHRLFVHGNLVAKNIVVGTGLDVFFLGYEDKYDLGKNFTWKQEVLLRKKGFISLQEYAETDYNLWRRDLGLELIRPKDDLSTKDSYLKRFSSLEPISNFARLFVKAYGKSSELRKIDNHSLVRIKTDLPDIYLDSTGVYRNERSAKTIINKMSNKEILASEEEIKKLITEAKTEMAKYDKERLSTLDAKDLELPEFQHVYTSNSLIRKRTGQLYKETNTRIRSLRETYVIDNLTILKLRDLGNLLNVNALGVSFCFTEGVLDLGGLIIACEKDVLYKKAQPLMRFCLKNNPKWFATLLLYAIPQEKSKGIYYTEEGLGWFYKLFSENIESSLIVFKVLKSHWNILYSYMILLLKCFAYRETPSDNDVILAGHLIGTCMRANFYDVLLYYLQSPNLKSQIIKYIPSMARIKTGGKNIRHHLLELAIPDKDSLRCRKMYPLPVGMNSATPKERFGTFDFALNQHTLPQSIEEGITPTNKDYETLIRDHLKSFPVVALLRDPGFDKNLLILNMIKDYDDDTLTDILFCVGSVLDPKKLSLFLSKVVEKRIPEVADVISKHFKL